MGRPRLNTEKKIDHESFKLKIGTTNKQNPQVIYIEGRTFISPLSEKDDYSKDITDIKRGFSKDICTALKKSTSFDQKFIVDFQVATSGIAMNKKSFLTFQFLLKQKNNSICVLSDVKDKSGDMIVGIVNNLEKNIIDHEFSVSKTKTGK